MTPIRNLDNHPDADLLRRAYVEIRRNDMWNLARDEEERRRLLRAFLNGRSYDGHVKEEGLFAAMQASTLDGLVAKCDAALASWREECSKSGTDVLKRMYASQAMCLEQAIATLQALAEPPPIVLVHAFGRPPASAPKRRPRRKPRAEGGSK